MNLDARRNNLLITKRKLAHTLEELEGRDDNAQLANYVSLFKIFICLNIIYN